jgi:predicted Fe-Mo cluster-binding NifX family protein
MKIAIASQNQQKVTAHAGQCRKFWIYEITMGIIMGTAIVTSRP